MKSCIQNLFRLLGQIAGLGLILAGFLMPQSSVVAQTGPQHQIALASSGGRQMLRGDAPPLAARAHPLGRLPGTNLLRLAISLPLRDPDGLSNLVQRLYDPTSPDYHHYLTPEQFTAKFGPTQEDYDKVSHFAKTNGLEISTPHSSRILLDVQGKVSDVERTFHVTMYHYQHPTEPRQFYAPDVEPSINGSLPIERIYGLSDYGEAWPMYGGSGPYGSYIGYDFRNAYAPGVSLNGAGQMVGLFELDGYYSNDITAYEELAGLPNVPLINVPIDGYSGPPGGGDGEVSLDIEMAISMAPGLDAVVVFEANSVYPGWFDMLDIMASSNEIKQFSCSWGEIGGNVTNFDNAEDVYFMKFAAQGQSFFAASGDSDASTNGFEPPSDSPYVTSVGGTTLTMNSTGEAYASETVWNENLEYRDDGGSSGGVSTVYPIPTWQQGVSMAANGGSTTMRNVPDVALTADNVYSLANNGGEGPAGGTSAAAPLWAGFMALVNEQAVGNGSPTVGFLNPAIYALGQGPSYSSCFHDITTGNNTNLSNPNEYYAVPGYDLCTGWGTSTGSNLINALAPPTFIASPPVIFSQPESLVVYAGLNALFLATVTGASPLSYQWQFNGAKLQNATSSILIITNAQAANLGSYDFIASNPYGSVTSAVAMLNVVFGPPVLVSQPESLVVYAGSNVVFLAAVTGSPPLSYQWRFNGTKLQSATGSILTINNAQYANEGSYDFIASNPYGSVTSAVATLTFVFPPPVVSGPASQTVSLGANVTFSVTVDGTGPFTYQWQFNGTNLPNNIITTVAGNGTGGYSGDGGAATNASLSNSFGLALDTIGNLYIADEDNSRIRKVNTNGVISTIAGTGTYGYSGDGGAATNARLARPSGLALDAVGNLFVADTFTNVVRKVNTNGVISTVAGNGASGYAGDAGAATNASLQDPYGVALDAVGNLYIADTFNSRIRKVNTSGVITTFAGTGTYGYSGDGGTATNASLGYPVGVALDAIGNLFIADETESCVRKVSTNGVINTVAGGRYGYSGDGGQATEASLEYPSGVVLDAIGNLFIADSGNDRIREVSTNGFITTVAGNGTAGYSGDGGAAINASLDVPLVVAFDAIGNLYINDTSNERIRKFMPYAGYPTLTLLNVGSNNAGNYTVIVTSPYGSVTSTVATLTVTIPSNLPQIIANGASFGFLSNHFGFNLSGSLGQTIVVDGSTNLTSWTPLFTNSVISSPFYFFDPASTNFRWRFYRARSP